MRKIEEIITKLPNLPEIVFELQKVKESSFPQTDKILTILEKNHFIVTKIIKMANSGIFKFTHNIDTLHNAVSLCGTNFIISLAICESINNILNPNLDLYPISKKNFFDLGEQSVEFMFLWLVKEEILLKEELIVPCLINRIGTFLMPNLLEDKEYDEFSFSIKQNSIKVSEIEKKFVGFSSSQITAMILENWNFDKKIINIIKNIDTPNSKESAILNVLNNIFNPILPFSKNSILEGLQLADKYNLDANELKNAIEKFILLRKNE